MDAAYAKLLHKLDGSYTQIPQALRSDILAFYKDLSLPIETRAHESEWARLQLELDRLATIDRDLTRSEPKPSVAGLEPVGK
jgi:hypothetical protein